MAYNTRRNQGPNMGQLSSASVGQRRPFNQPMNPNFVPGGKLAPDHAGGQAPTQQQPQRAQGPQFAPNKVQPVRPPQQGMPPTLQPMKTMQQSAQQIINQQATPKQEVIPKEEEKAAFPAPPVITPAPPTLQQQQPQQQSNGNTPPSEEKKKPAWMQRTGGKISKKERVRRRNLRLRKMLQPKNALMVLNEMVGNTPFVVSETQDSYNGNLFRCTVVIDGVQYVGAGRSKLSAKTEAAETALKSLMLTKLKMAASQAAEPAAPSAPAATDQTSMEVDETDENTSDVSWAHFASYALHKLLLGWGEDNFSDKLCLAQNTSTTSLNTTTNTPEKKPAKKMPDNAASMNPVMLLNQMIPTAVYEEISKSGSPPNVLFTMKCTIGDQAFLGTGSSKKTARRECALAACKAILKVEYPEEPEEEPQQAQ